VDETNNKQWAGLVGQGRVGRENRGRGGKRLLEEAEADKKQEDGGETNNKQWAGLVGQGRVGRENRGRGGKLRVRFVVPRTDAPFDR